MRYIIRHRSFGVGGKAEEREIRVEVGGIEIEEIGIDIVTF